MRIAACLSVFALCMALACAMPVAASADDAESELPDYSSMSLDDLKAEVENKRAELEGAQTLAESITTQIADVQGKLDQALARIVGAQALAERSVRERYKVQRQYGTLVDALLCAEDFDSFLAGVEYIEKASKASVGELTALRGEIERYKQEKSKLEQEKESADKQLARISTELEEATKARDEAQRKADLVANAHLKSDGANWKAGKKKFVSKWTKRIDAYLAGTPMAGQGEVFAEAAWENHIDPRFSPAISFVESGNGSVCIRPYNAWGWGAAEPNPYGLAKEWSSWEEAIHAHVSGLAEGYGYTITKKGAKKYCPPNWEEWYAITVDQMNQI